MNQIRHGRTWKRSDAPTRRTPTAHHAAATVAVCLFACSMIARFAYAQANSVAPARETAYVVEQGTLSFEFEPGALEAVGWQILPTGHIELESDDFRAVFQLRPESALLVRAPAGRSPAIERGALLTRGAFMLADARTPTPIGYLALRYEAADGWTLRSGLHDLAGDDSPLAVSYVRVELDETAGTIAAEANVIVSEAWARSRGTAEAANTVVGVLHVEATLRRRQAGREELDAMFEQFAPTATRGTAATTGPDLLVAELQSVKRWGRVGDVTAYSIGTTSCNIGDVRINWIAGEPDHPVVAQQFYRLKEGRFEQIGLAWVKHTFIASNGTLCSAPGACMFESEAFLGVGCSDIYNASINGAQTNLAPRIETNATTGELVWPGTRSEGISVIDGRLQVRDADLDPDLNAGALYFLEGQYLSKDDAIPGNQDNNASYRPATVSKPAGAPPNYFRITQTDSTRRGQPAILAWGENDPEVDIQVVDVPNDRRFFLGSKVTALDGGLWHYEYALQNLNSDRSGQRFSVPVPPGVTVSNVGFHDVDYHSGSPVSSVDWSASTSGGVVSWETETFDVNPNANALRWGTLYNFRFDADTCPAAGTVALGLFKPGDPPSVDIAAKVPGEPIQLTASDPPDLAIDARQPSALDGTGTTGWQGLNVTFSRCASGLDENDFVVTDNGGGPAAPGVALVNPTGPDSVEITLDGPIADGAWTTIALEPDGPGVRLGFQPGDVDGDGTSGVLDVIALIDVVNGVDTSRPGWATDLDRSGRTDLGDVLRLVDLLIGAGEFRPYMSSSLP